MLFRSRRTGSEDQDGARGDEPSTPALPSPASGPATQRHLSEQAQPTVTPRSLLETSTSGCSALQIPAASASWNSGFCFLSSAGPRGCETACGVRGLTLLVYRLSDTRMHVALQRKPGGKQNNKGLLQSGQGVLCVQTHPPPKLVLL